jgi:hypothetical protein
MSSSSRGSLARKRVPAVFANARKCVAAIFDGRRRGANNCDFIEQNRSVRAHKFSPIDNERDDCLKHTGSGSRVQLSFLIVFLHCRSAGLPTC